MVAISQVVTKEKRLPEMANGYSNKRVQQILIMKGF